MQFKTKDLLVTVLPTPEAVGQELAKICLFRTYICRYPTFCYYGTFCKYLTCAALSCGYCSQFGTFGCGFLRSCGPGGSACDPTIFCPGGSIDPFVIQHVEDLVTLRAELHDTLKKLDEIEKAGLPTTIQSRSEAEAVERSLTDALEQIRKLKGGLK